MHLHTSDKHSTRHWGSAHPTTTHTPTHHTHTDTQTHRHTDTQTHTHTHTHTPTHTHTHTLSKVPDMTDRWFRPPFFGNSNTERLNGQYSVGRGPGGVYNRFPRKQSDIGRLDYDADVHENRSSHVLTVRVAGRIHIKLILDPLEYVYGTWGVRPAAPADLRDDKKHKACPDFLRTCGPQVAPARKITQVAQQIRPGDQC